MNSRKAQKVKGAIEILEEAVHILRLSPGSLLGVYYIGSLPFVLALLYFWADMSRNAAAEECSGVASFGLAMLFVWMKCWQAIFAQRIKAKISFQPNASWTLRRVSRLTATQSLTQASGLFVLPVALILALPFGWVYAFYQNASAEDGGDGQGLGALFNKSWDQAKLWPGQNHFLLLIFSLFGLFVFLNLALSILLLPYLLKKFFGIETMFTMSGLRVLNTTFLAATVALAYLCMDPLVKTVYALRCFYGSSLGSGDDLKAELKNFTARATAVVPILIVLVGAIHPSNAIAREHPEKTAFEYEVRDALVFPEELNRSIEEVMNRPEFTWRMPRERLKKESPEKLGPVAQLMDWILGGLKTGVKAIGRWMGKINDWLEKHMPKRDRPKESSGLDWLSWMPTLFWVLLATLIVVLAIFFWRTWQRRRIRPIAAAEESTPSSIPDLTDDQIKADELPADRWLTLAREFIEKGDFRLALRALFLATLAHLATQEVITIAKHKSNRDYERELRRRAHQHPGLPDLFSGIVRVFERSWYGSHDLTGEDLKLFGADQERIMAFVEG